VVRDAVESLDCIQETYVQRFTGGGGGVDGGDDDEQG